MLNVELGTPACMRKMCVINKRENVERGTHYTVHIDTERAHVQSQAHVASHFRRLCAQIAASYKSRMCVQCLYLFVLFIILL